MTIHDLLLAVLIAITITLVSFSIYDTAQANTKCIEPELKNYVRQLEHCKPVWDELIEGCDDE